MATKKRGDGPAGTGETTVTILHVSDMQFGIQHRFGRLGLGGADEPFDTLLRRLTDDLDVLRKDEGIVPDLVALTGDFGGVGDAEGVRRRPPALRGRTAAPRARPRPHPGHTRQPRRQPEAVPGLLQLAGGARRADGGAVLAQVEALRRLLRQAVQGRRAVRVQGADPTPGSSCPSSRWWWLGSTRRCARATEEKEPLRLRRARRSSTGSRGSSTRPRQRVGSASASCTTMPCVGRRTTTRTSAMRLS